MASKMTSRQVELPPAWPVVVVAGLQDCLSVPAVNSSFLRTSSRISVSHRIHCHCERLSPQPGCRAKSRSKCALADPFGPWLELTLAHRNWITPADHRAKSLLDWFVVRNRKQLKGKI